MWAGRPGSVLPLLLSAGACWGDVPYVCVGRVAGAGTGVSRAAELARGTAAPARKQPSQGLLSTALRSGTCATASGRTAKTAGAHVRWRSLRRKKVGMTTLKSLVITLLMVVTMLTILGWVLIRSTSPTMGGGDDSAADSDFIIMNGLGETKAALATNLPEDFEEIEIVGGLRAPTNMEFSPDGRLFVLEQAGKILIIKNGELLPTPFLALEVDSSGEGGLLGLAFDPQFSTNGHFYVYYAKTGDPSTNQVSRFTVSATNTDVDDPSSELVILDGIPAYIQHNGAQMQFGPDRQLYVATGEITKRSNAQSLRVLAGKILRINPDGSVPADNPFVGTPNARGEIWAYGLRNPFAGDIDPVTGR